MAGRLRNRLRNRAGLVRADSGVADLSGFERLWIASLGAFKSLAPDVQFDGNNNDILAWDDLSGDAVRLLPDGGANPFGQVPWAAVGGPDDAAKAVGFLANQNFGSLATAMEGMGRAAWTIVVRCHFGGNSIGFGRFILLNSTANGSWRIRFDYLNNLIEILSAGTDDGDLAFIETLPQDSPITILSRYDGTTHFGAVYNEIGVLIEALTTSHSGVTRTDDSFLTQAAGDNRQMDVKKMVFYDRFMDDDDAAALVENSLTDEIPT